MPGDHRADGAPGASRVEGRRRVGDGHLLGDQEFYETQYRIIQSTTVGQRTAEKLGLQYDPDYAGISGPNHNLAALGRAIAGQVSVKPLKDSRLALITVTDRKPQRAALIANTIADTYIEYNLDFKLEDSIGDGLAGRAGGGPQAPARRFGGLKLYQYKKDRNLLAVSLDDKQSMLSANLSNVNSKLTELHIKLIELDAKRKMIQRARNNIADEETLPEIREKGTIEKLRDSYVEALTKEYADVSSRYGAEHPKMKALTGQMDSIRKAYEQEIDAVLATFEKTYQELLDNEHALKALMEQQKSEAISSRRSRSNTSLSNGRPSRKRRCTASSLAGRRRSTSPGR